MERVMTIPEAAVLWKIIPQEIRLACEQNVIKGAFRIQSRWFIPEAAARPHSGKPVSVCLAAARNQQ